MTEASQANLLRKHGNYTSNAQDVTEERENHRTEMTVKLIVDKISHSLRWPVKVLTKRTMETFHISHSKLRSFVKFTS